MTDRLATGEKAATATVAFVDLAGYSAITDVFGDQVGVRVLDLFEAYVSEALQGFPPPVKWIGDEVMLAFSDPEPALAALGRLLPACRAEAGLPLTRVGLHHGPIIRRDHDLYGATVNLAARMTAMASPGQLLASRPVATAAAALGISVRDLGEMTLRSVARPVSLFAIDIADAADPAWVDPVCKMHAPFAAYFKKAPDEPWFCSPQCAEAYRNSPETYPLDPRLQTE